LFCSYYKWFTYEFFNVLCYALLCYSPSVTVTDVKEKNGEYFAQVEMKPKFAGMRLPPFCSPAIFQLDPMEAEGNITKWEALHLAGLIEDPAYGARIAILRGACMGTADQCSIQFKSAKTLCPKGRKVAKTLAQRLAIITKGNTTFSRLSPEAITDVEDINQNIKGIPGTKAKGEANLVTKKHPKFRQLKERAAALTKKKKTRTKLEQRRFDAEGAFGNEAEFKEEMSRSGSLHGESIKKKKVKINGANSSHKNSSIKR